MRNRTCATGEGAFPILVLHKQGVIGQEEVRKRLDDLHTTHQGELQHFGKFSRVLPIFSERRPPL